MRLSYILFLVMMSLGPAVAMSSSNWIICWVGLELMFLGTIPLLFSESNFFSLSKESAMKYFCIQALSSALMLFSGVLLYLGYSTAWFFYFVFVMSLFMKLGIFPMHFWVPSVVSGLDWVPIFFILVWQKIPPLAIVKNFCENFDWISSYVLILGGLSAVVGSLIGLNQTSFRAMLGASSIAHTGWACFGAIFGGLWFYFLIYSVTFFFLMISCFLMNYLMSGFLVLSLSGVPPFTMFIGKWSVMKSTLYSDLWYIYIILPVFGAILSLFFYLKFFYSFYLKFIFDLSSTKYPFIISLIFILVTGVIFIMIFFFGDRE